MIIKECVLLLMGFLSGVLTTSICLKWKEFKEEEKYKEEENRIYNDLYN